MTPPPGIPPEAWDRFPLAKRRLVVEGPGDGGGLAVFETLLIAAAEARRAGVSQEDAEQLCRTIPFDATESGKLRKKLRELPRIVRLAYNPRDGEPVLTGCPRDPVHSGNPHTSRLRARFASFCNDECARSCPILRAARDTCGNLTTSPFAAVYHSTLWADGVKLGLGLRGRLVYERLASLALGAPDHTTRASQRYVASKLGDLTTSQTVGKKLRTMQQLGLVTLLDKRTGLRQVHALSPAQVRELEENYGTLAKVEERQRVRRAESDAYAEWIAEEADRLARWTLAQARAHARGPKVSKTPA